MISNPRNLARFSLESFQLKDRSFVIKIDDSALPKRSPGNDREILFLGPHLDDDAETGYTEPASSPQSLDPAPQEVLFAAHLHPSPAPPPNPPGSQLRVSQQLRMVIYGDDLI